MERDELAPVREGRLDLNLVDELRDSLEHLIAADDLSPRLHELLDRPAVARGLEHPAGEERDGLGVIELDAAGAPVPRHDPRDVEKQLVLLVWRKPHGRRPPVSQARLDIATV